MVRGNKIEVPILVCTHIQHMQHTDTYTPTRVYLIPQNMKVSDLEMKLQKKHSILGYIQTLLIYMVHVSQTSKQLTENICSEQLPDSSMLSCSGSWGCPNLNLGFLTS